MSTLWLEPSDFMHKLIGQIDNAVILMSSVDDSQRASAASVLEWGWDQFSRNILEATRGARACRWVDESPEQLELSKRASAEIYSLAPLGSSDERALRAFSQSAKRVMDKYADLSRAGLSDAA